MLRYGPVELQLTGASFTFDAPSVALKASAAHNPTLLAGPPRLISNGSLSFQFDPDRQILQVNIPLVSTDHLYYRESGEILVVSNDLRVYAKYRCELDPLGLYSILQLGLQLPPFTIWRGVRQFMPGRSYVIDLRSRAVQDVGAFLSWPLAEEGDKTLGVSEQGKVLTDLIDKVMVAACTNRDPVILFSGGVDSGVLAARAAAMGWSRATLVNYQFGNNDGEAALAEQMARKVGLDFVQVRHSNNAALNVLGNAAADFMQPFGDPSGMQTYALACAVMDRFGTERPILDGTGADGAFGLFSKIRRYDQLYRVPRILRALIAAAYPLISDLNCVGGWERAARVARRTVQLPILLAPLARNPLANVFYKSPDNVVEQMLTELEGWTEATIPSHDPGVRVPALDLALNCAKMLAQKDKSVFETHGRRICYPFLDERIVGLALQRSRAWPGSHKPKNALKYVLSGHIGAEMVYRPKSGFVGPYSDLFQSSLFLKACDALCDGDSIFEDLLDKRRMARLRTRISHGCPVPDQTYWFLWTAAFANEWVRQVNSNVQETSS